MIRRSGEAKRLTWAPSARAIASYWPNWADLIRCLIALATLVRWGTLVRAESPDAGKLVLLTIIAIAVMSFFIQAYLVLSRRTLFVPLPLFIAAAVFVPGWDLGVFAVIVSWAFCAASKKFDLIIPILAGILMVGGIVLGTSRIDLVVAAFIVAFPQLIAFMSRRRLVLPSNAVLSH